MKVFVATYDHKHGTDVRVFQDESKAETWRQEIVAEWWNSQMEGEKPSDPAAAADAYFEFMEMQFGAHESFSVSEAEVE